MNASIGRIVLYKLSANDADLIRRRRVARPHEPGWPAGAQAHVGNSPSEGDIVPLIVVHVWPDEYGPGIPGVNGQAMLDGNDQLWVTSVEGVAPCPAKSNTTADSSSSRAGGGKRRAPASSAEWCYTRAECCAMGRATRRPVMRSCAGSVQRGSGQTQTTAHGARRIISGGSRNERVGHGRPSASVQEGARVGPLARRHGTPP